MDKLPNIWKTEPDADTLYSIFFSRLGKHDLHHQIVEACRTARRYARASVGIKPALFTFDIEINALEDLGDYRRAWSVLRKWDLAIHGRRRDVLRTRWTDADAFRLVYSYGPILYLNKRYNLGRTLLEKGLALSLAQAGRWGSYSTIHSVYKPRDVPTVTFEVSLRHFYDQLGEPLTKWRGWRGWVRGLHPKLLSLAGVQREALLSDSSHLRQLFEELKRIRAERCPFPVSRGQRDLIDDAAKVRRWNKGEEKRLSKFMKGEVSSPYDKKLAELFPDVGSLGARG